MGSELIDSLLESYDIEIVESDNGEKKPMRIKGVAGKAGIVNRNRRLYSNIVYTRATEEAQPKIKKGKLLGEVDHPDWRGSLVRSAFKFTKLEMDGDLMRYEGDVLPTPSGKLLESLLRAGVGVGVSTRGRGSMEYKVINGVEVGIVQDDFVLDGIDFVLNESNPYGGVEKFESEGGRKMTLEELREKYPDLVKQIEEEHETKVKEQIQQDITESLNAEFSAKIDEAKATAKEEGKNEILESEEYKKATEIFEAVKGLANPEKLNEEADEKLATATQELATVKESLEAEKTRADELQAKIDEAERKEKLATAIEEACKDYKYADHLRKQLAECHTAEEVSEKVDAKKGMIESIVAGINPEDSDKGVKNAKKVQENDEAILRAKRLAGLI